MQKVNYQLILDKTLENIEKSGKTPTLLLHSCCAPCSSYCLEYLSRYFSITVFYYNPNISPEAEFTKRCDEQIRLISALPVKNKISFIKGDYEPQLFYGTVKGREHDKEGGEYCKKCYRLRLEKSAEVAKRLDFDYFTTTLSISPQKNSATLNEIGISVGEEYGIPYLQSDFKKREGYKRSTELSQEYGLYRQNFCGCIYSKCEAEARNST